MSPPEGQVGAYPNTVSQQQDTGSHASPDDRLHSKIVEILSSTSNDCVIELGYPRMMEKLRQSILHAQSLQEDNARLYQDNCHLTAATQMLKERIAHLLANPNAQLQQFSLMQERIRTLENERESVLQNNQDILISINKGTSHHLLAQELERMRARTNHVLKENQIIQNKYMELSAAQRGQMSPSVLSPSNSVPSQPRILTPSDVHQRQASIEGASRLQPSRLPQQQFQQQAQHARQMQPQVRYALPPQQLQHAHQVYAQRRVSDGVQNPYPPHQPASLRWTVPPPASAPPVLGTRSPTDFPHIPTLSAPVNYRPQRPLYTYPLTHTSQTGYQNTSAPLVPFNMHPNLHSAPPTPRPALSIDLTGEDLVERTREQQARGGRVDQPNGLKRTSSAVEGTLSQAIEAIKRQRTAQSTQSSQDAIVDTNPEPKSASPDTVVGSKPTSPVSPSLPEPLAQEKMDAATEGQVAVANDEVAIAVTPSDTAVSSNPTSPAQEKASVPPSGDNMRSVEDCVYMIYEPDAEVANGYFCGRCLDRFESNMVPEPPDVLVNPKFEDLLIHCTKEHPTIWEDLRNKRDLEALAPPS
ncbi:hypothetical protein DEU56DRAFT_766361 [Suillus clintonianus]|uniref:uncharacterized protein n=1 Tax=Suillus clintonianus TaxID=1904413 RepID=UPI001B86259B|nr:uncharacterized protein DEU56DRAFT_766361 [Suillus clintonianus]KAG2156282.1 hypothetical protein DEU56DRAFT_766361 [Suillus clintonianus]